MATSYSIRKKHCLPFHPNANGQAERYVGVTIKMLRHGLRGLPITGWANLLPELQLILNCTYHATLGCAPFLLMFGGPPTPLVPSMRSTPVLSDSSPAAYHSYRLQVRRFLQEITAHA